MIRHSLNYVPWKDKKAVAADLKHIYTATNQDAAELALASFKEKWDHKYPTIAASWQRNWQSIIPFLAYPDDIRKAIYTTNTIESINRQIRYVLKTNEISIFGLAKCSKKMDNAYQGLETGLKPICHPL